MSTVGLSFRHKETWTVIGFKPGMSHPVFADRLFLTAPSAGEMMERVRRRSISDSDFRQHFAGWWFFPVMTGGGVQV